MRSCPVAPLTATRVWASVYLVPWERSVELRRAWQARLIEDHPLILDAVISQAVLRRAIGGPEVMREQLKHLIAAAGGGRTYPEQRSAPVTGGRHGAVVNLGSSTGADVPAIGVHCGPGVLGAVMLPGGLPAVS